MDTVRLTSSTVMCNYCFCNISNCMYNIVYRMKESHLLHVNGLV